MVFGENIRCLPNPPDYIFLYFTPYSVPPFGRGDCPGNGFGVFFLTERKESQGKRGNHNQSLPFINMIIAAIKSSNKVNKYPVI